MSSHADELTLEPAGADDGARRAALLELLGELERVGYRFVTATPATHARVVARPDRQEARALRDVLGWSLPFRPDIAPPRILDLMRAADVVQERPGGRLASTVRVSSVRECLFLHSAYPTDAEDSVFLGPDSYRFADFIALRMRLPGSGARILDYAAGAGVGGITAAVGQEGVRLTLADLNPKALFLAGINAAHAGLNAETVKATAPGDLAGPFDLIVTHPPFMIDEDKRFYRDGGDLWGARLSLDWVLAGAEKLAPGGQLILHTGVSIVEGRDVLLNHLRDALPALGCDLWYHELDPDIFGEEMSKPAYAQVERIAAVGAVVTRKR
jgi:methylase of polypeptide subunit release factors